ncbi:unnamed protein product [Polarella glacialis]|uniref:Uncharacterized protein n=1 Tax=Polarella glacialis TaxID=89957 RepID=A0A813GRT4_POLGL|nr:unnamed protein product [Polarella glacialis]
MHRHSHHKQAADSSSSNNSNSNNNMNNNMINSNNSHNNNDNNNSNNNNKNYNPNNNDNNNSNNNKNNNSSSSSSYSPRRMASHAATAVLSAASAATTPLWLPQPELQGIEDNEVRQLREALQSVCRRTGHVRAKAHAAAAECLALQQRIAALADSQRLRELEVSATWQDLDSSAARAEEELASGWSGATSSVTGTATALLDLREATERLRREVRLKASTAEVLRRRCQTAEAGSLATSPGDERKHAGRQ